MTSCVDTFAPQGEFPIGERAVVVVDIGVFDYGRPFANATLTPLIVLISGFLALSRKKLTNEQQT